MCDIYLKFDKNIEDLIDKNKFKWLSERCKSLGIVPKNSNVVDLGSGHGQNTLGLSVHFGNVYGIEPSEKMLKYARNLRSKVGKVNEISNVRFYMGNFVNIPIKQIDVLCLFNSIHYSKKVFEDLIYILSVIVGNGILIISEPHNKSIFGCELMRNSINLKRKLKRLEITRNEIKKFIKWCKKYNKASIILEKETSLKYLVIIQKL